MNEGPKEGDKSVDDRLSLYPYEPRDVLRALLNAGRQDKETDDETGESEGPEGGLPSKD